MKPVRENEIEITRSEIEPLTQQRLQSGALRDVEDVILQALRSSAAEPSQAFDRQRALVAGAHISELSKGLTSGGLTIRELIDEGRP